MAMLPHVQKPQTVTGGVSSPGTAPSCQEPLRPPTPYLPGSHHPEEAGLMPGCPEFKEATHGRPDTHTQEDPPGVQSSVRQETLKPTAPARATWGSDL